MRGDGVDYGLLVAGLIFLRGLGLHWSSAWTECTGLPVFRISDTDAVAESKNFSHMGWKKEANGRWSGIIYGTLGAFGSLDFNGFFFLWASMLFCSRGLSLTALTLFSKWGQCQSFKGPGLLGNEPEMGRNFRWKPTGLNLTGPFLPMLP
ncbi:hypothetical protein B0T09DRAFT_115799 [Sordaria sp. MPI-SDFR-AT-0083]|nr:hypothetical protein B0T09DRAFT_115799 [Sordaria sp. MPI-SDFR-AT-0083]